MNEIITQEQSAQPVTSYELVATDAAELARAHDIMRAWLDAEREKLGVEQLAETENERIARERKWSLAPFRRRAAILGKRIEFLDKVAAAIDAGFVLVPNFEMDIFAIRTDQSKPSRLEAPAWRGVPNQTAKLLPAGEGEYHSNRTMQLTYTPEKIGDKQPERVAYVTGDWLPVDFPLALAKPVVMTRTAEAMALKIFDEFGVASDTQARGRRHGDPFILGRIRNPRKRADVTCFIGWTFDPSVL